MRQSSGVTSRRVASLVTRFSAALRSHAFSESDHCDPHASDCAHSPPRTSRLRRRALPLPPPRARGIARLRVSCPHMQSPYFSILSSDSSILKLPVRQFACVLVTWNVRRVAGFARHLSAASLAGIARVSLARDQRSAVKPAALSTARLSRLRSI